MEDVSAIKLQRQPRRRLALLFTALVGVMLILAARLFYWQVLSPEDVVPQQEAQSGVRGEILDKHRLRIVINRFEYDISAAPSEIENVERTAQQLDPYLSLSMEEILERIRDREQRYALLAQGLSAAQKDGIMALGLPGIHATARPRRFYVLGEEAGHVAGFVNWELKGAYGVEGYYDELLQGVSVSRSGGFLINPHHFASARDGYDLVLTLDGTIQHMVAQVLQEAVERYQADGGTIIVMDPRSGAIWAMVNYPSFDPNEFATTSQELYVNPAISHQYEPGSVLKVTTVAAALDAGAIALDTTYEDTACMTVVGATICNWDRIAHGTTTITETLQHSLNVGAVHYVMALGPERLYRYMEAFGFGQLTGVDLANEVAGMVRTPDTPDWSLVDLATNSFGQGIATTPLQVVVAIAAVANGGRLMKPYVMERAVAPDGTVLQTQPTVVRQVVSPQVAREVTRMLVAVVEGEVTKAAVPGYSVAGKTGTAQIPDPEKGGYEPHATIVSFVGYAPSYDPRFIVLVKIDRPHVPRGSEVAAPVFKTVAEWLLAYLAIPPDHFQMASR
ncbi:MAG: peptidoglycan D,D-transpeptidase FtsI family protein [Anaerolineae bacterium]